LALSTAICASSLLTLPRATEIVAPSTQRVANCAVISVTT
jgi:hypothetical protein